MLGDRVYPGRQRWLENKQCAALVRARLCSVAAAPNFQHIVIARCLILSVSAPTFGDCFSLPN